jgi:hypothetical protein
MVTNIKKYLILLILLPAALLQSQPNTFVSAKINADRVKVKQSFEIRISVYTTTWFTSAPNLDNIVIQGALTVKKDRAQSTYETIKNVRYTILYFDFIVFPAVEGKLEIPEIEMNYSTPEEGGYKGIDVVRKTKPLNVIVDPLDEGYTLSDWLVANSFSVKESWNKKLNELKVGDVIERTITINATGTIAALIPSPDSLVINWGRQYYRTPVLNSEIKDGVIRAERIEKTSLLLEKPGEYTLPEQKYSWWNPRTKKNESRILKEKKFIIEDNPDLVILRSIQDSLDAINSREQTSETESEEFTIVGLKVWQFLLLLSFIFLAFVQARKLTAYIASKISERRAAYLNSEGYYFKKLIQSCRETDLHIIRTNLVEWIKKLNPDHQGSLSIFFLDNDATELKKEFDKIERALFGNSDHVSSSIDKNFTGCITEFRKQFLSKRQVQENRENLLFRLNP